jgi:hypothetical protein
MFCGLASMFCGGQICSVVARNKIKPLFHTKNSHFIMILDVLSDLITAKKKTTTPVFSSWKSMPSFPSAARWRPPTGWRQ